MESSLIIFLSQPGHVQIKRPNPIIMKTNRILSKSISSLIVLGSLAGVSAYAQSVHTWNGGTNLN